MDYLRLGSQTNDLVLGRTPLDPVIRQCLRRFARMFILKKLTLHYPGTDTAPVTDAKWTGFILEQLLSNAIKYTPRRRHRDRRRRGQHPLGEETPARASGQRTCPAFLRRATPAAPATPSPPPAGWGSTSAPGRPESWAAPSPPAASRAAAPG